MIVPGSGPVSLSQINTAYDNRGLNLNAYRGTQRYLQNSVFTSNLPANQLGFSDFRNSAGYWYFGGNLEYGPGFSGVGSSVFGSYFCGPHNFASGSRQEGGNSSQWRALGWPPPGSGTGFFDVATVFFPNGPSTHRRCRLRLPYISYDVSSTNFQTDTGITANYYRIFPYPQVTLRGAFFTELFLYV